MLEKILIAARQNADLKHQLLAARDATDPADALCTVCRACGFDLQLGDLFAEGETFNDNLRKSVNGGATEPPDGWDDSFDLFFASLEGM